MTKEQTLEAIKVMQAWTEGKACQWRYKGNEHASWDPIHCFPYDWRFDLYDFRVKPEPRVVWATILRSTGGLGEIYGNFYSSHATALKEGEQNMNLVRLVKFVEST